MQRPSLLRPLTKEFQLEVRPPSAGIKILGVPLVSERYVRDFFLDKFDGIDAAFALATTIAGGRVAHNIHRATASACLVTHLLRLILSGDVSELWQDFEERQSKWFGDICELPRFNEARRQSRGRRRDSAFTPPARTRVLP